MTESVNVVIGEGSVLTKTYETIIEQEFPVSRLFRLKDIEKIQDSEMPDPISVVLVEQEQIEQDMDKCINALSRLNAKKIVLVYSDDTIASSFFFHVRPRENFRVFGFLPMNLQLDCWLSMLRLLFLGQSCVPTSLLVDPQGIDRGDVGPDTAASPCDTSYLTPREQEILQLVAEGKQNKLIACDLAVSEHTVKLHIHHIIKKLGVRNRTEAARVFYYGQRERA